MVVAECPKIFDVECIWGRIFVSLENIFVFKCFYMENVLQELFLAQFFGYPYHSNGTKIHLDAEL